MKVKSRINNAKLKQIEKESEQALIKTAEALKNDLIQSQTMPFDTGDMQNNATYVDSSQASSGSVLIVTDAIQARRLYFHPEYNFSKEHNPNAGGMWFEPYINGDKKDFVKNTYNEFMKGKLWDYLNIEMTSK